MASGGAPDALLAQEVALIGMLGYLSYLCGELAGLSGIVTVFCCAVAISHYALHNIRCSTGSPSPVRLRSRTRTKHATTLHAIRCRADVQRRAEIAPEGLGQCRLIHSILSLTLSAAVCGSAEA